MSSNRSARSGRSTSSLALSSRWTSLDGGLLMRQIIALDLDQNREYSLYCDPGRRTHEPARGGKDTTMSHKDLNPVNRKNPKRVAIVISNPVVSTTTNWPVGFWGSELSDPYFRFTELGYQAEIFSPEGGACAADPRSDPEDASQWQGEGVISRGYKHDPDFMNLVQNTKTVDKISLDAFDAIVVAGGGGPRFTMEKGTNLDAKLPEFFEAGKNAARLCPGVAGRRQ